LKKIRKVDNCISKIIIRSLKQRQGIIKNNVKIGGGKMKKFLLTLTLLLISLSLFTSMAFTQRLEITTKPGEPTIHSLDDIYNLVAKSAVPRYKYWYGNFKNSSNPTIHTGSGVIHTVIVSCCDIQCTSSDISRNSCCDLSLYDGSKTIASLSHYFHCERAYSNSENLLTRIFTLDIEYNTDLKVKSSGFNDSDLCITVTYLPDK